MSDPKSDQEPTMEEILASIRRIIAEDNVDAEGGRQPLSEDEATSAMGGEAEPLISEATGIEAVPEDNIFELTQEVRDDGTVVDIATGENILGGDAPGLVELDDTGVKAVLPSVSPSVTGTPLVDGLVGSPADAASTASFENLAHAVVGKRTESGIKRDSLRPGRWHAVAKDLASRFARCIGGCCR